MSFCFWLYTGIPCDIQTCDCDFYLIWIAPITIGLFLSLFLFWSIPYFVDLFGFRSFGSLYSNSILVYSSLYASQPTIVHPGWRAAQWRSGLPVWTLRIYCHHTCLLTICIYPIPLFPLLYTFTFGRHIKIFFRKTKIQKF